MSVKPIDLLTCLIAVFATCLTTIAAASEPPFRVDLLLADDATAGDRFGGQVAIAGNTAAATSTGSGESGAVYVFVRDGSGWQQQARLVLNSGDGLDVPGAIDLSGNTLVVGSSAVGDYPTPASGDERGEGRVHIFERAGTEWSRQALLRPDASLAGQPSDAGFGSAVAVSGNTVIVAARPPDESSAWTGTAYVYVRDGEDWALQQTLSNSDGNDSDSFGQAVLLEGNTAVVSAPGNPEAPGAGAVYVFARSGTSWDLQQKIVSSSPPAGCYGNDLFGAAIALSGSTLAIWDPAFDRTCHSGGITGTDTLIFVRDSGAWTEQARLADVRPESLSGNLLSISCDTPGRIDVYLREAAGWSRLATVNGDLATGFGADVELESAKLLIGAPFDASAGADAGAALLYLLSRFYDVAPDYWAYAEIESLAEHRITGGCGGGNFCPRALLSRAQLAVFIERGKRGGQFVPPAATGEIFVDVSSTSFAAGFIEQLYADGITTGCGEGRFCPNEPLTRSEIAVYLLLAKYGHDYLPPTATGTVFDDVAVDSPRADWIEQLARDGITLGCDVGIYCPERLVPRDEAAAFIVRTFGLL